MGDGPVIFTKPLTLRDRADGGAFYESSHEISLTIKDNGAIRLNSFTQTIDLTHAVQVSLYLPDWVAVAHAILAHDMSNKLIEDRLEEIGQEEDEA